MRFALPAHTSPLIAATTRLGAPTGGHRIVAQPGDAIVRMAASNDLGAEQPIVTT
jgi:hypothetical protein